MSREFKYESDEKLMVLYQKGEYAAFTELYDRYAAKVHGYIRSKITNAEASSELSQQVFLNFHKSRARYNNRFPVAAWIFTIARNVLIDYFRKKREFSLPEGFSDSTSETVENISHNSPLLEEARKAIEKLPENQRVLLTQRFEEGLSFEEIAEKIGVSSQTLRKRVSRIVSSLKRGIV